MRTARIPRVVLDHLHLEVVFILRGSLPEATKGCRKREGFSL
jgi:hypothetical protein